MDQNKSNHDQDNKTKTNSPIFQNQFFKEDSSLSEFRPHNLLGGNLSDR